VCSPERFRDTGRSDFATRGGAFRRDIERCGSMPQIFGGRSGAGATTYRVGVGTAFSSISASPTTSRRRPDQYIDWHDSALSC
jgi:hypothetical protein